MKLAFRAAIAALFIFSLWLSNGSIALAQDSTTDALLDTVEAIVVEEDPQMMVPNPPAEVAVEVLDNIAEGIEDSEADLSDIFSPIARAMTTTDTTLKADADSTSLFEALADVNEAADKQALGTQPETLEGSVQNWLTSVKTFLELE
ncbi:MAG: hypothetical protein AAFO59_07160 [Cyanobacteria bacterium J06607_17]